MTTVPVLQFEHVARGYATYVRPVIADVSFAIGRGEVVALLGRNGSGKTTLVNLAMGMLHPDAGTVRLFGLSPTEHPVAVKRRVGYVAEDQMLPPTMTVPEILAFHRAVFPTWDAVLERQLLDRFAFPVRPYPIDVLSKGQARQLALICAVCHRPELLILDEPAGGLDPAARREFLETSIQLLNREGTAILFSSHHMTDVERLGGRVVVLNDGCVALDEPLDALRESHCVAMIPRSSGVSSAAIGEVAGCLHVRGVLGEWHAVFRGPPSAVADLLRGSLHLADISCTSVPLEELFIELLGDERLAGTGAA